MGTTENMQSALDADIAKTAFCGKWKNVKAEGMEELLVAFGVSWMKRTAASTINYYVGSATDEISKNANGSMTVKSTGGSSNRTTTFQFGDTVETDGPNGNHLVMEITCGGATAKRYFEKM